MPDQPIDSLAEPPLSEPEAPALLAPAWHTLAILLLLFAWGAMSARNNSLTLGTHHIVRYTGSIAMSWMLFGSVIAGIYFRRKFFINTLERNAAPWHREMLRAIGLYLAVMIAVSAIMAILHFFGLIRLTTSSSSVRAFAPASPLEFLTWIALCVTAGFSEEHIFRGYLLPQFIAVLRRSRMPAATATFTSIVLTSAIFGALHLYQGARGALLVTALGIVYCMAALTFRNLRAVMLAHFFQDFIAGFFVFLHHSSPR